MSNKNVTIFKNIGLGLVFLFGIISCEKDFEDIAVDLIDNKAFSVGDTLLEIISYNKNIMSSRVDNNEVGKVPLSLLGVYQDNDFGYMKSALISQLSLPIIGVNFGDNAVIDLVVVDMPYLLKDSVIISEITEDKDTIYETVSALDSIYGNRKMEYNITVNELGTFLNTLDPLNPSKRMKYYSDKDYLIKDLLHTGSFKPNVNDTVLYVERRYLDDDPGTVDDIDTIKAEDLSPSIKLVLNSDFFKNRFVDHQDSPDFDSNSSFTHYFRGLYIDAEGVEGSIMNLTTTRAKMTIYYTNDVITNEGTDEDLNGNGVNGEDDVVVKTKQTMDFTFGGVKTGKYIKDYNQPEIKEALDFPNVDDGEQKLFIQGASGSEAIIDLFPDEFQLEDLREKDWLINEANLTIYIHGDQKEIPSRLFLYNYEYESMISDNYSFLFGPEVFGGVLEYDNNGKPEKYKFRITKYIKDILDKEDPIAPSILALKNFVNSDGFDPQAIDTIVHNFNWIPKGVVLKGNLPETDNERIKLEIYYSKSKLK